MSKPIDDDFDYKVEVKKCKTIDDVMGKNGLIQRLVKDVLENILEGEMEEYLGRNKYQKAETKDSTKKNYRNAYVKLTTRNCKSKIEAFDPIIKELLSKDSIQVFYYKRISW